MENNYLSRSYRRHAVTLAIGAALGSPETACLTNRKIAQMIGCSDRTVGKARQLMQRFALVGSMQASVEEKKVNIPLATVDQLLGRFVDIRCVFREFPEHFPEALREELRRLEETALTRRSLRTEKQRTAFDRRLRMLEAATEMAVN